MKRLAGFLAILCTAAPASAELAGHWTATSTASIAITGNITVADDALTFGNGTTLRLIPAGTEPGRWTPLGDMTEGRIFRLQTPSDPALLNGSTLCGMPEPVTYIALTEHAPQSLGMTVFTSSARPVGFGDDSCASYFYER